MFNQVFKIINSSNLRSANIKKNVFGSFAVKGGNVVINLLMVPLLLDYLNPTKYGIWLTVNSIISWFIFFNVGLGHGLRNKFAEKKAEDKDNEIKTYVSTAYFSLFFIAIVFIILFLIINHFLDWTVLLNTEKSLVNELSVFVSILFFFFAFRLVFNLISSILLGDQKPALSGFLNFVGQFIALISLYILVNVNGNSLIYVGLLYTGIPVVVLLLANIYLFYSKYRDYIPSISYYKLSYLKSLANLGTKFFIIEAAFIILYTTDNFIITHLFSPADVAPYNIAFRYFGIMTMLFSIINTPFWSAYTEAYTRKDFDWIKKVNKKLKNIWLIFSIGIIFMILISPYAYKFWIGEKVEIPFSLTVVMGLNAILAIWNNIYVYFINGVGKIKLQSLLAIFGALIHIPFAYLLAKVFAIGITGVILATFLTGFVSVFLLPKQYKLIISNTAAGIWNK